MRALICTVLGLIGTVGCLDDVRTPLLVSDGEITPSRDRGPQPDERVPDARAPDARGNADDAGEEARRDGARPPSGDAGCSGDRGFDDGGCSVDAGSTDARGR